MRSAPGAMSARAPGWPSATGTRRLLATRAGDVELKIPKLRKGSFMHSLLEPRRRIDKALPRGGHGGLRQRSLNPLGG